MNILRRCAYGQCLVTPARNPILLTILLKVTGSSGVCVNGAGLHWKDLSYLNKIPLLDVFCVNGFSKGALETLDGIDSQSRLKEICLDFITKAKVNWESFTDIRKVFVDSCFLNSSLWNCQSILDLAISNCSERGWDNISKLHHLEKLTIIRGGMKDLNGLISPELHSLEMHLTRNLESFSGSVSLPKMRKLHVNGCRKINNINDISKFENLEDLHLVDCGYIKSLKPLLNMKRLKNVYLFGTFVEDNSIRSIVEIPGMREFVFDEKPDYDMRLQDALVYLGVPRGSWPAILRA